jgi:hypothetical protein
MKFIPSKEQMRIMMHALGYDRSDTDYRNIYCVVEGTETHKQILELCRENLMYQAAVESKMHLYYMVNNEGKALCKRKRK